MSVLQIDGRDGKLRLVEGAGPRETMPLWHRGRQFRGCAGIPAVGEPVVFRWRADGAVTALQIGESPLVRRDPVE